MIFAVGTEEQVESLETTDILETVTGSPSVQKAAKEEENKVKEKEEKIETQTLQIQQVEIDRLLALAQSEALVSFS